MITKTKYLQLQALFFSRVTSGLNPSKVVFEFISVAHANDFEEFTGDGTRTATLEISLGCFYMRNISDKQREKMGIRQEVTDVIYISPLELQQKYGNTKLPGHIRNSYSQFSVSFLDKHYEIDSIIDLEPMHLGNEETCIAYQLNLKGTTGNRSIN